MGFELQAFLKRPHPPGTEVHLFLRGQDAALARAVAWGAEGGEAAHAGLVSARVPVERVAALAAHPAVQGIEFSLSQGRVLNDSMRCTTASTPCTRVRRLPGGFTGEGVLVGIIDRAWTWTIPTSRMRRAAPGCSGTGTRPFRSMRS